MKARVSVHRDFRIGNIDERIYSGFLEHLGRCRLRRHLRARPPDRGRGTAPAAMSLDLVRDLNVPLRPLSGRQFRLQLRLGRRHGARASTGRCGYDHAWRTTETNVVGTDEFVRLVQGRPALAPMLAVEPRHKRARTRRSHLAEYSNHPERHLTEPDLRSNNGYAEKPLYDVRVWCLGNEMDGPWQLNHRTAHEYGRVANEVGRGMKIFDPTLQLGRLRLVACAHMPTYREWEREVLIRVLRRSRLHLAAHLLGTTGTTITSASSPRACRLDRYIQTVGGIIDHVKAQEAFQARRPYLVRRMERLVPLASTGRKRCRRQAGALAANAPPLLEDVYNFEDVLLVDSTLTTFIRPLRIAVRMAPALPNS